MKFDISVLSLTLTNIIARSVHFVFFIVLGNIYGISAVTEDVFFLYAPIVVMMAVATGVADVIVMPAMHRAENFRCTKEVCTSFKLIIYKTVPVVSIIIIFAMWIIRPSANVLTLIILAPIPILSSVSSLYSGVLNSHDKHKLAVLGPVYGSILSLPTLFILPISAISLASVLLIFEVGRYLGMYWHSRIIDISDSILSKSKDAKKIVEKSIQNGKWQILGSLFMASSVFIDILFASTLGNGSITSVEYVGRLWNLVPLLFFGYLIYAYARMSKIASSGKLFKKQINKSAIMLGITAIVISGIIIFLRQNIIDLVYGLGSIGREERVVLANLLGSYVIGAAPFLMGLLYVRALSAIGQIKTITKVSFINLLSNIILNFIFIKYWGLIGIGLATSMTYLLASVLLFIWYKK